MWGYIHVCRGLLGLLELELQATVSHLEPGTTQVLQEQYLLFTP